MLKSYTTENFQQLQGQAEDSGRRRAHMNVHETLDANVQRLFIATEPDTYIRPHRHSEEHKWEFFTVLSGEMVCDGAGESCAGPGDHGYHQVRSRLVVLDAGRGDQCPVSVISHSDTH